DWSSDVCSSDLCLALSRTYTRRILRIVVERRERSRSRVEPIESSPGEGYPYCATLVLEKLGYPTTRIRSRSLDISRFYISPFEAAPGSANPECTVLNLVQRHYGDQIGAFY